VSLTDCGPWPSLGLSGGRGDGEDDRRPGSARVLPAVLHMGLRCTPDDAGLVGSITVGHDRFRAWAWVRSSSPELARGRSSFNPIRPASVKRREESREDGRGKKAGLLKDEFTGTRSTKVGRRTGTGRWPRQRCSRSRGSSSPSSREGQWKKGRRSRRSLVAPNASSRCEPRRCRANAGGLQPDIRAAG